MQLCINFWGEGLRELTGRPAASVLGKKYYEVFPRIYAGESDALHAALKDGKRIELKGYTINCLCDQMTADITISPVKATGGEVDSIRVDITPSSTCVAQRKLQHAQRFIDIGKMASTLAHGVRNPLNAIKGAVIYLREKYADESTLIEFTKIMEDEITRLDNFISKFLSTSVSDAEFSETDVNSLLRKVEISTSLQARANGIRPEYRYGKIPHVMVNSFQLEHAILNVVNNAIEAMPSGGKLLVKTRKKRLSGRDFVVIDIEDNGPGMAGNRLDDVLMQAENRGRGFGVFLTREVLQYYGGHLEIKSEKGSGTTASLYLPRSGRSG
jgi:two-component system nitrogen regulation sensor histidine kinase GlnL